MECCNRKMSDFSYSKYNFRGEKTPHFYCLKCGRHYHDGQWYTTDEWFFYINGITYEEYQNQLMLEEFPHAHELINHSDPEDL